MASLESPKMGIIDRVKSAVSTLATGKKPASNPLSMPPKDASRAALVTEWNDRIVDTRKFWKPVFERIRQEQKFAAGKQWPGSNFKDLTPDQEDYVGDMCQQLVNRKTASLYSKNPTPEAVLKDRMNFTVWDGRQSTIDACHALLAKLTPIAMQAADTEQAGQPVPRPPPQMQQDIQKAQEILADYSQGMQEKEMLQKVADTGERLIKQQWDSQTPDLLISGKQATTRIITSRVCYIKVMYKREMEQMATETANDNGFDTRIQALQAKLQQLENDPTQGDDNSEIENIRLMKILIQKQIQEMQQASPPEVPSDEGVVLDWLSSTSIIIDRRCKSLKEFVGANWIAQEILMTVAEVETKYKINLTDSGARIYTETAEGWKSDDQDNTTSVKDLQNKFAKQLVCVWEVQDKDTGLTYTLCDGVQDFLEEPHTNDPEVNRFWSIVPITFNAQEVETNDPDNDATVFPRSDIRLAMPMCINVNRAGQEKRTHRSANRPAWITFASVWASVEGESDLKKLSQPREAHDVFRLQSVNPDAKLSDLIQPLPKQPFDEWLYGNEQDSQAMMLATGQQASDIGEQRPDEKATGQNIAAQARATSESSNIDDLNQAWSTVAQMMWEMLIKEMPQAKVQELVGRGATWPELNREQIADSIFLRIEAGSTGAPNQQSELAKLQVMTPLLTELFQATGKNPEPVLKYFLKRIDPNIDLDKLLEDAQEQMPPPPPQQEQPKPLNPPSVSISANLKDLPLTEQAEAVSKFYGLKPASPAEALIHKVGVPTLAKPPEPPKQNNPNQNK